MRARVHIMQPKASGFRALLEQYYYSNFMSMPLIGITLSRSIVMICHFTTRIALMLKHLGLLVVATSSAQCTCFKQTSSGLPVYVQAASLGELATMMKMLIMPLKAGSLLPGTALQQSLG